jgi:hypothetical protein
MRDKQEIDLELFEHNWNDDAANRYTAFIYIDNFPIYFDVFDTASFYFGNLIEHEDFIILKSNRSEEILNGSVKCPEGLTDFTIENRQRIKSFALGRLFSIPFNKNEFSFGHYTNKKYKIVSYIDAGMDETEIEGRIKFFDFVLDNCNNCNLLYRERGDVKTKHEKELLGKYKLVPNGFNLHENYFRTMGEGLFNINFPGIGLSQPFRLVDGVISKTVSISTIVYQDIYKDFPCVKLPVCGYYGTGDWKTAKEILNNLDNVNVDSIYLQSLEWYRKYLSAEGMWYNQILSNYKSVI